MSRIRVVVVLLVAALMGAACGDDGGSADAGTTTPEAVEEGAAFPVTVAADNGDVTLETRPTAIVSLSPSVTEMLYAIGAGDQVTAVDTSSDHPEGAPVTDLSGFRPNVEAIGALGPDLVVLARDRDDVVATLEATGLPVLLLDSAESLDDVYGQIEVLGAATGHGDGAAALVEQMRADVDELVASVDDGGEPLTFFYELSRDYHTVTSGTFVGAVLELAGLRNIADEVDAEAGEYPQLTAEFVLAADPDLVLVAHSDGSVPTLDELAARPGWTELTAVANDDVVLLDPDIASRWGPRVVDLLEMVIAAAGDAGSDG